MTGLACQSIGAMENSAVQNDAVPDTGAQCEHVETINTELLPTSQMALCQGSNIGIIIYIEGDIEIALKNIAEIETVPSWQIGRSMKSADWQLERPGCANANADAR